MSADRDYQAGTRFALLSNMSKEERKALEWMYTVKTTRIESKANLILRWINGIMTFEATEDIKRGQKFLLYEGEEGSPSPPKRGRKKRIYHRTKQEERKGFTTATNSSRRSSRLSFRAKLNYTTAYTSDEEDTSPQPTLARAKRTSKTDEKEGTGNKRAKKSKRNPNPEKTTQTDPTSDESEYDLMNDDNDSSYNDTDPQHSDSDSVSSQNSPKVYAESEVEAESDENNSNKSDESNQSESESDNDDDDMSPEKFTCKVCSKIFPSLNVLKEHKKVHVASVQMHFCKYCKRAFVYDKSLTEHLKEEHGLNGSSTSDGNVTTAKKCVLKLAPKKPKGRPKKNLVCHVCGKEFRWKASFDDHVAMHAQKFVCKFCDMVFGKEIFLDNHMVVVHKLKPEAQPPIKTPNKRGRKKKIVDDEKEDEPKYDMKRCYVKLDRLGF